MNQTSAIVSGILLSEKSPSALGLKLLTCDVNVSNTL